MTKLLRAINSWPRSSLILVLVVGVSTLYRFWLSLNLGLGADEAHYFLYGHYVDWSYFDHPPMVGWIEYLFQFLALNKSLLARLPALLCSLLTSWLFYRFLRRRHFSPEASRWGVIAINSTLLFNLMGVMWLPDTPLMPLTLLILDGIDEACEKNQWKSWALLGFYLGLAGLTKYTSVFFIAAIALYFLRDSRWRKLLSGRWLIGVAIGIILILPILIWNVKHDFASIKYQSNHIFSFSKLSPTPFLQTHVAQWILWGFGFYILGFQFFFTPSTDLKKYRLEGTWLLCLVLFIAFLPVSLGQFLLPHWLYVPVTLMIGVSVCQKIEGLGNSPARESQSDKGLFPRSWPLGLKTSFLLAFTSTFVILAELGFQILPSAIRPALYKDIAQWDTILAEANRYLDNIPAEKKGLAVLNWSLGSRSLFYNEKESPLFILDNKFTQFDLWNSVSPQNYDLVIFAEDGNKSQYESKIHCESLSPLGHLNTQVKETPIQGISFYHCKNFQKID